MLGEEMHHCTGINVQRGHHWPEEFSRLFKSSLGHRLMYFKTMPAVTAEFEGDCLVAGKYCPCRPGNYSFY
jgi:hypothetical protein